MKRANGEGTWAKKVIRGNEYYIFKKTYPEGRKEFSGKKKSEIQEKVKKYEAERKILANKKTYETFTQYATNYVEKIASKNISESVLDSYLNIIKCRVAPTIIGDLQLGQINKAYLDEYIKYLVDQKYARSTIEKTMRVVRHVIEYGIKEDKIRGDVLDDFKAPSETKVLTPKKEVPFLDIEDMQKLYEEAKKPKYSNNGYIVILIMYTGIRAGEMQELRWKDIDMDKKTLTVKRTAVRVGSETMTKNSPKSAAGVRTIPLGEKAMEAINYFDQIPHTDEDFVCRNINGRRVERRRLQRSLDAMLANSGASVQHCGLHSLRHSFGSALLENGVDIKVVSILLGHQKVTTTYDHYIHIINKRLAMSVEQINKL